MMYKSSLTPTTYQQGYKGIFTLPPIKYHQPMSIVHRGIQQQPPRQFPVEPLGPQRKLRVDPHNSIFGTEYAECYTEKLLEPKPIVGSLPPQEVKTTISTDYKELLRQNRTGIQPSRVQIFQTKFGPMDSKMVDDLVRKVRWTSTTANASEEAVLPIPKAFVPESTLEKKADIVRLSGQKYELSADDWQRAVFWDCLQPRRIVKHTDLEERTYSQPEKLCVRRCKREQTPEKTQRANSGKVRQLIRDDNLSNIYVRQCPGYSGFVPRAPTEGEIVRHSESESMVSTMKATYRKIPKDEYGKRLHARQGPLSKTVTLTYPFNPYNKIQKNV